MYAVIVRLLKRSTPIPDERSHRTVKDKIRYDLLNAECGTWASNLPIYARIYNESPHRSLGDRSPYEAFFGFKSNHRTRVLQVGREPEDNYDPEETKIATVELSKEDVDQWLDVLAVLQAEVKTSSDNAAVKAAQRKLAMKPPSQYDIGDSVLVKFKGQDTRLIRGGRSTPRTVVATIVERHLDKFLYKVQYLSPINQREITEWRKVDDITSTTRSEEKRRQELAKENHGIKGKCECADSSCSKPTSDKCSYRMHHSCCKKTIKKHGPCSIVGHNNAQQLWQDHLSMQKNSFHMDIAYCIGQESITHEDVSVLRGQCKLNDKIINLYMECLKKMIFNGSEKVPVSTSLCIATTFFLASIASLIKSNEMKTRRYTKHMRKVPGLFALDKMVVPAHVDGDHWIFVVIDSKAKTISFYDSLDTSPKYPLIEEQLRDFIKEECNFIKLPYNREEWSVEYVKGVLKQARSNQTSCGPYMLKNMKNLLSGSGFIHKGDGDCIRDELLNDIKKNTTKASTLKKDQHVKQYDGVYKACKLLGLTTDRDKFSSEGYHDIMEALKIIREDNCDKSEREALYEKLERSNLQRTIPETPSDGNCLFHAIAHQISITRNIPCGILDHFIMRQLIIQYMEDNKEKLKDLVTADLLDMGLTWNEYIANMKKVGEWGDQVVLAVSAIMLQCNIVIVAPNFTRTIAAERKENQPLYIGYIPNLHFMSLEHKDKIEEAVEVEDATEDEKPVEFNEEVHVPLVPAMSCLPAEIITIIINYACEGKEQNAVKLRCVCKQWKELITPVYLEKLHMQVMMKPLEQLEQIMNLADIREKAGQVSHNYDFEYHETRCFTLEEVKQQLSNRTDVDTAGNQACEDQTFLHVDSRNLCFVYFLHLKGIEIEVDRSGQFFIFSEEYMKSFDRYKECIFHSWRVVSKQADLRKFFGGRSNQHHAGLVEAETAATPCDTDNQVPRPSQQNYEHSTEVDSIDLL
ncbi:uncharacterized protein [Ptychodera flava]|uniref:uncharacterized protein n=1 Tax=Ptychodera flava TaxID=63121 RepID=UPI003969C063